MLGALTVIKADGRMVTSYLEKPPTREQIQSGVGGGRVQRVPGFNMYCLRDAIAFCDADGKLKGLPENKKAQRHREAAMQRLMPEDCLVGDVVIITGNRYFLEVI